MLRVPILMLVAAVCSAAPREYQVSGLVLAVDRSSKILTVSHGEIAGYMDAMVMPFLVSGGGIPAAVHPGDTVSFTLRVDSRNSWIENIRVVEFNSADRDPVAASRLRLMDTVNSTVYVGERVPDFRLTDQSGRRVSLVDFRGKTVVMDFIYTRCPLPDYCFRLSNNFARLQKRFAGSADVVLLTVTFDPAHDTPEALTRYARIWHADLARWHFLTGSAEDIRRVCERFGVGYWPDEGLYTHTLHTVVVDRQGKLAANMEGNRFTAKQLGDLIEALK